MSELVFEIGIGLPFLSLVSFVVTEPRVAVRLYVPVGDFISAGILNDELSLNGAAACAETYSEALGEAAAGKLAQNEMSAERRVSDCDACGLQSIFEIVSDLRCSVWIFDFIGVTVGSTWTVLTPASGFAG